MNLTLHDEAVVKVFIPCDPDTAFAQVCKENPKLRIEQTSEGEIIIMPPAGNESSYRTVEIIGQLRNWAGPDGRGKVFDSNTVFRLSDSSKLGPDAAWISKDKLRSFKVSERKKFMPVAPEFIIELRSESDRVRDLHQKMKDWISNGVQLAWLIDAGKRRVWIYLSSGEVREEVAPAVVLGEGPVAGFRLVMEEIYFGLDF